MNRCKCPIITDHSHCVVVLSACQVAIWIIMKIFTNTWTHTGLFWWASLKVFAPCSTLLYFCKLAVHSSLYTDGNNTDNAGRPHTTLVTWSIPLMFSFHADVLWTCTASPIVLANVWLITWHKSLIFIKLQTCLNIILKCFSICHHKYKLWTSSFSARNLPQQRNTNCHIKL